VSAKAPCLLYVKTSRGRFVLSLSSAARDSVRWGWIIPRTLDDDAGDATFRIPADPVPPQVKDAPTALGWHDDILFVYGLSGPTTTRLLYRADVASHPFLHRVRIAQRISRPFEASAVAAP